jgi:hypothetical protein
MKYINATGDTVFSGGPIAVIAKPGSSGSPDPTVIPIEYVGVGADAETLTISPDSFTGRRLSNTSFAATLLDSSDAPLPLAPVAFTSTDSQRVRVDLRTGATSLLGARGTAKIIAQTLTGQADTATVSITPVATSLVLVSGGGQQIRQGEPFPLPIRVRANAVDNFGVAGVVIGFTVQSGQGSVSQMLDTTDANGDAEVIWTAGDSAGNAVLRAQISETVGIKAERRASKSSHACCLLRLYPNTPHSRRSASKSCRRPYSSSRRSLRVRSSSCESSNRVTIAGTASSDSSNK